MGQYDKACQIYEMLMRERPSYRSGFNLLVCYCTSGQHDKIRQAFTFLLKIPYIDFDENYPTSVRFNRSMLSNLLSHQFWLLLEQQQ
mgnify:CR=1 FL=1